LYVLQGGELGEYINTYIKEGKIIPVAVTIGLIKGAIDSNMAGRVCSLLSALCSLFTALCSLLSALCSLISAVAAAN
jgi:adenylate kinase family enzyme